MTNKFCKKILFISHMDLTPPLDGGRVVIASQVRAFSVNFDISLIVLQANSHYNFKKLFPNVRNIKLFYNVYNNGFRGRTQSLMSWLFGKYPKGVTSIFSEFNKKEITKFIIENNIKIIVCEFPHPFALIDFDSIKGLGIHIIIIAHGVEPIFFRELRGEEYPRILVKKEMKRWAYFEKNAFKAVDKVIGIAPDDVINLKKTYNLTNIVYLPPYIPVENKRWKNDFGSDYMVFCGSLLFYPNYDGIMWFINNVCHGDITTLGDIKLKITGKVSRKIYEEFKKNRNVEFTGYLSEEELEKLLLEAKLTIVPIRRGSGIKIKLLKSLAYGIPTIASDHAALGVPYYGSAPYLTGHTESDFFNAAKLIINDSNLRNQLSQRAIDFFNNTYGSQNNINAWIKEIVGNDE